MNYAKLVELYEQVGSTSRRLEKTAYLCAFLEDTPAPLLADVTLLLQGKIFPPWEERTIGFAAKLAVKVIAQTAGLEQVAVIQLWKQTGDLGETTEKAISKKKQVTLSKSILTIEKVLGNLRKLAHLEGGGSVSKKVGYVSELLASASPLEGRYIIRTVLEELRVGVGEGVLRDAITWANTPALVPLTARCSSCGVKNPTQQTCLRCAKPLSLSDKSAFIALKETLCFASEEKAREYYTAAVALVQNAYDVTNDFGVVAHTARTKGIGALSSLELSVGKPLKVMLAIKANNIAEALETVGTPADAEYKLDGFRLQIHRKGDAITLFTRRLENVTTQFPDVVTVARSHIKGEDYILDSEVAGYNPQTKKYRPFQEISQRIKRKYGIAELQKSLPVEINVFDILWLKGKQTISLPLKERLVLLETIVKSEKHKIVVVPHLFSSDERQIQQFYTESLAQGNEGIMLKNLDAPYKPGARVGHMIKIKPTLDAMDLVIVGAQWGEGKRSNWLSSYELACQNEEGELLTIGRVATGLKEKEEEGVTFAQLSALLEPLITHEEDKEVTLKPRVVIEVTFEEIQKSPSYESGYALRFPRFVSLREDKPVNEIATFDMVEEAFFAQKKR